MAFKQNLLKKIEIDALVERVKKSIGSTDPDVRIDKDSMRRLLEIKSYPRQSARDLELYLLDATAGQERILVLDNDLPIYHTTVEDIALRKSPTVKEMISIRNIIKILKDDDVISSKKEVSLATIRSACLDDLDLSFTIADIEALASDGAMALERGITEGVQEVLTLWAEILPLRPPPKALAFSQCNVLGFQAQDGPAAVAFGPLIIYNIIHNTLKLIASELPLKDRAQIEWVYQVAQGQEKAHQEGAAVFEFLKAQVHERDIWKVS